MAYCSECGGKLREGARFCQKCGNSHSKETMSLDDYMIEKKDERKGFVKPRLSNAKYKVKESEDPSFVAINIGIISDTDQRNSS